MTRKPGPGGAARIAGVVGSAPGAAGRQRLLQWCQRGALSCGPSLYCGRAGSPPLAAERTLERTGATRGRRRCGGAPVEDPGGSSHLRATQSCPRARLWDHQIGDGLCAVLSPRAEAADGEWTLASIAWNLKRMYNLACRQPKWPVPPSEEVGQVVSAAKSPPQIRRFIDFVLGRARLWIKRQISEVPVSQVGC